MLNAGDAFECVAVNETARKKCAKFGRSNEGTHNDNDVVTVTATTTTMMANRRRRRTASAKKKMLTAAGMR